MNVQSMVEEFKKYEWFELCVHTKMAEVECCGDLDNVSYENVQGGLVFTTKESKLTFYSRDIKMIQYMDDTFIIRFRDGQTVAYCMVG